MGYKYSVGDRVICVQNYGEGALLGDTGTVVRATENDREAPIVHWDDFRRCRHDAHGIVQNGHGWFIYQMHIEPYEAKDLGEFAPNLAPGSIASLFGG